jgi:predicted Fe-Mo cluster-binding NifX family protein
MKVAVASTGEALNAPVDPRFGRCPYIVVVDTETMESEGHKNPGALAGTGAGIAAAQLASDAGAEAVICNVIGPHAYRALDEGGIEVYGGASGTVESTVTNLADGELDLLQQPNASVDAGKKRKG